MLERVIFAQSLLNLVSFVVAALIYFEPAPNKDAKRTTIKVSAVASLILQLILILTIAEVPTGRGVIATLVLLTSSAFFFGSLKQVRRHTFVEVFNNVPAHALVTDGYFSVVRHPFYFSYLMTYVGGCIATLNPLLFLQTLWMTVLYLQAIKGEEERLLNSPFAEQYRAYQLRSRRLIPYLY